MLGRPPKPVADAALIQLPHEIEYLWGHFLELMMAATPGGFGPVMLTWEGIEAWSTLMRVTLDPWEARMLATLSVIRANVFSEAEKKKTPPAGKK